MKTVIIAAACAAAVAAGCDRPPTTASEYNNSGASATPAQNAPIAAINQTPAVNPNLEARVLSDASGPIGSSTAPPANPDAAAPVK